MIGIATEPPILRELILITPPDRAPTPAAAPCSNCSRREPADPDGNMLRRAHTDDDMGLSWQQGPLGRNPSGTFLGGHARTGALPRALRRRMSVELGGRLVARSDDAVLLFEPARYPVAYFPLDDVADGALQPIDHRTTHPDLGETRWFDVVGETVRSRAPPGDMSAARAGSALRDAVAFAWRAMDAFYEEDERILGHAADPYHRIDIRRARGTSWSGTAIRSSPTPTRRWCSTSPGSRRAGTSPARMSSPTP